MGALEVTGYREGRECQMLKDHEEVRRGHHSHLSSEFQCRASSSRACACCRCLCSRLASTLCMGPLGRAATGSVGSTFFCKRKARQMVLLERAGEWLPHGHREAPTGNSHSGSRGKWVEGTAAAHSTAAKRATVGKCPAQALEVALHD